MAMNRVQLQAGLSMPESFERDGTESKCRAALARARWPEGFVCPKCAGRGVSRFVRGQLPYWQCEACRHQTSVLADTYHAFDFAKYAHRYLAEFQNRFNRRYDMAQCCSDCSSPSLTLRLRLSAPCGRLRQAANQVLQ